jgi:ABC-type nitrate/sulfonate/bicarbonate transport system ATPase subunit
MIGQEYFELRSRLGADLYTLSGLLRQMHGSADQVQILDNLMASLNDPFVFVVVGEVNVGKSTFLNALFGSDFSRTGVMPTTDKIYFFKHGPEVQTTPIGPHVDEVRVPCDFLRDFHIVDTPGTNSIENEHQQITERFVPMADLVIFTFSAMNPWGASAWQFLDRVHRQWMRNVVFVLQQCDLRTPEEIQVITDYMRQLSRQRFGQDFPLFPVSAKKAYLARSSGVDPERLLADSGFHELEAYISSTVTESATRLTKVSSALKIARTILHDLIDRAEEDAKRVVVVSKLLDEMQAERDVQVSRTKMKFAPALDASDRDFRDAAVRVIGLTQDSFSLRRAFGAVKEDLRLPKNLDHKLYQDLLSSAGERWQQVAVILQDDFRRFEEYVAKHWQGALGLDELLHDSDGDHASDAARQRFIAKVESTLRRFVLGLQINEVLEPGLISSRAQARRLPAVLGGAAAVALLIGWLLGWQAGCIAAAAVLLLGLGLLLSLRMTLQGTLRQLAGQFDSARSQLKAMLEQQTAEDADSAFAIFSRIIIPERSALNERDEAFRQQLAKLFPLRDSFDQLALQVRGRSAA